MGMVHYPQANVPVFILAQGIKKYQVFKTTYDLFDQELLKEKIKYYAATTNNNFDQFVNKYFKNIFDELHVKKSQPRTRPNLE